MRYYNYRTGVNKGDIAIRATLIVFGLLIGVSGGFWIAIRTIPLPDTTIIYVAR